MLVDVWGFVDRVSRNPFVSRCRIGVVNGLSELLVVPLHGILAVRGGYD